MVLTKKTLKNGLKAPVAAPQAEKAPKYRSRKGFKMIPDPSEASGVPIFMPRSGTIASGATADANSSVAGSECSKPGRRPPTMPPTIPNPTPVANVNPNAVALLPDVVRVATVGARQTG